MDIKLSVKPEGEGNEIYVVSKNDGDNFQGLWYANSDEHMREQLIGIKCCSIETYDSEEDYKEDYQYASDDIDTSYCWIKIGNVKDCI